MMNLSARSAACGLALVTALLISAFDRVAADEATAPPEITSGRAQGP